MAPSNLDIVRLAGKVYEQELQEQLDMTPEVLAALETGLSDVPYHPRNPRMYIQPEKGGKRLICHYDPKEFTEQYSSEWEDVPITGSSLTPLQYKVTKPRKWSMQLLFNELGDSARYRGSSSDTLPVDESLRILASYTVPSGVASAFGLSSAPGMDKPPVLLVFNLVKRAGATSDGAFRCCLTGLSITRLKIHPDDRRTLRATADVEFTEYIEGKSGGWW